MGAKGIRLEEPGEVRDALSPGRHGSDRLPLLTDNTGRVRAQSHFSPEGKMRIVLLFRRRGAI